LEEPPRRVPLLRIEIIGDDRFSEVQKRCDDYIAEGAQVWLLEPQFQACLHSHQNRWAPRVQGRNPPNRKPAAGNGSEEDL